MNDMEEPLSFLDTPKKSFLHERSRTLRLSLKEFERSFAQQNNRKPNQTDIKKDSEVAARYKQYQRVRDVLSGKLAYENLDEDKEARKANRRPRSRRDSGIGSSPRHQRSSTEATPQKSDGIEDRYAYGDLGFISPQAALRNVIGPTPHRDGKVLGMFDLMQRSGATRTPSTSARKRKLEEFYRDTPAQRSPLKVIQTPSRRAERRSGDLLGYLQGTPEKSSEHTHGRFSKTPQSEGRKFQLSQFFATPSTQRILFSEPLSREQKGTPLRDSLLGLTPEKIPDVAVHCAKAAELTRSTSFKDRLLSASRSSSVTASSKDAPPLPPPLPRGPPTLRHFRSSTSNILQSKDLTDQVSVQLSPADDGCFDDDLEAIRECETVAPNHHTNHTLVEDSQVNLQEGAISPPPDDDTPVRVYKKKGQKRTTRKAIIKPVMSRRPATETTYVAADQFYDDEWDQELVEGKKLVADADDSDDEYNNDNEHKNYDKSTGCTVNKTEKGGNEAKNASKKGKRQPGMINPNAQSHMNFKTLKIKNKSSRAKHAGRGRFSRRR